MDWLSLVTVVESLVFGWFLGLSTTTYELLRKRGQSSIFVLVKFHLKELMDNQLGPFVGAKDARRDRV
jgi:hypothetical protein